jgi:hypothetical protein
MQIIAVIEMEREFEDLYTLRNVVQDMAAIITDGANLTSGQIFEVQLLSVHDMRRNRSIASIQELDNSRKRNLGSRLTFPS